MHFKFNLFLILVLFFLSVGCQLTETTEKAQEIFASPTSNEINISLEKYLGKDTVSYLSGGYSETTIPTLLYTNPTSIQMRILPINNSDTLKNTVISVEASYIIIQHKYDYDDFEFFVFKKGDSVRISYQSDGRPIANILNRKALKYDLGLKDLAVDQPMSQKEAYSRLYGIVGVKHLDAESQMGIHTKYNKFVVNLKDYYQKLIDRIDSVYSIGQMSKEVYAVQKTYYKFKILSGDEIFSNIKNSSFEEQDSLFRYEFSRNALTFLFRQYGYKPIKVSNGFGVMDYKIVMDSVLNNKYLSPNTRDYLLYYWMTELGQSISVDETKAYFSKFKITVNDKKLISELESKLLIDLDRFRSKRDTLYLVKNDRSLNMLKEFLSENKGRIVYVDFWASWCAPCIKEMPASRRLRKDYENAPVTFLYLSIDKDYDAWNKSNTEQKLRGYPNSYMIVNKDQSSFLSDLELSSIPRYLIFDKQGRLVDENAPRPSHASLRVIIDSLIKH
ncbi:TlpA family protein disulfide reductase [Roseivirga echinicomitans]